MGEAEVGVFSFHRAPSAFIIIILIASVEKALSARQQERREGAELALELKRRRRDVTGFLLRLYEISVGISARSCTAESQEGSRSNLNKPPKEAFWELSMIRTLFRCTPKTEP